MQTTYSNGGSLFSSVVLNRENNNGRYSSANDQLLRQQYPVGFLMFTDTNLRIVRSGVPASVSQRLLLQYMREAYYAFKANHNESNVTEAQAAQIINTLNEIVLARGQQHAREEKKRHAHAIELNSGRIDIERRPVSLNRYDRTVLRSGASQNEVRTGRTLAAANEHLALQNSSTAFLRQGSLFRGSSNARVADTRGNISNASNAVGRS